MLHLDFPQLDLTISRFARQRERFCIELERSDAQDHVFEMLPPEFDRELYTRLRADAAVDPLAGAAARWIGFLLVEHACLERTRRLAHLTHRELHPIDKPDRGSFSFAEVRRRALRDGARREAWLSAARRPAESVGARRLALEELKAEERAALPIAAEPPELGHSGLLRSAENLLKNTEDAYRELGLRSFSDFILLGLGRDVPGVWPSQLLPRAFADWFREGKWLAGLEPEIEPLPERLGVSSWLRGLERFGRGWHAAGSATRRPFVLYREPQSLRGAFYGSLFALLPLDASFAARRLDVPRSRTGDYQRALGKVVLLGVRSCALRAVIRHAALEGSSAERETFERVIPEALGFELPRSCAGAWFARESALSDFGGLLLAALRDVELTQRHDEDWFRNPRAVEELREDIEAPPTPKPADASFEAGARALTQLLSEAL